MKASKRIAAGLVLLAALLLAGCGVSGGGDGDGAEASPQTNASSTQGPLTKEEFVKRADEICKRADDQTFDEAVLYRETHAKQLNRLEPIPAEITIIRAIVFPSIRKQIKEIKALGIPKGEEREVRALYAAMALGMRKAEKAPYEIEGENPSKYPFDRYSELSREYGFGECSNLG